MSSKRKSQGHSSSRSQLTSTDESHSLCAICNKPMGDLDHLVPCRRCGISSHSTCAGFDDACYRAFIKVRNILSFFCPSCKEAIEGLESRLAQVESKLASLTSMPAVIPQPPVGDIVAQVIEALLPRLTEMMTDLINEASEIQNKKHNLVIVNLPETLDAPTFVNKTCDSLGIDHAEVVDCFGDGPQRPGRGSRITKVKFRSTAPRRTF